MGLSFFLSFLFVCLMKSQLIPLQLHVLSCAGWIYGVKYILGLVERPDNWKCAAMFFSTANVLHILQS